MKPVTYRVPVLTEREHDVALDHADPGGPKDHHLLARAPSAAARAF